MGHEVVHLIICSGRCLLLALRRILWTNRILQDRVGADDGIELLRPRILEHFARIRFELTHVFALRQHHLAITRKCMGFWLPRRNWEDCPQGERPERRRFGFGFGSKLGSALLLIGHGLINSLLRGAF
jgi:hypothetical protein